VTNGSILIARRLSDDLAQKHTDEVYKPLCLPVGSLAGTTIPPPLLHDFSANVLLCRKLDLN